MIRGWKKRGMMGKREGGKLSKQAKMRWEMAQQKKYLPHKYEDPSAPVKCWAQWHAPLIQYEEGWGRNLLDLTG